MSPSIRFKTSKMNIDIVSVLTPEEYKIRDGPNDLTIRLTGISPKLKFGWDSGDTLRVRCLLLGHPFLDQRTEAYVYIDGGKNLVEDMLIHENGKIIILKKWLREQEIIR